MNRILVLCAALFALSAPAAFAEGVNLSYDDCGVHGAGSRIFYCTTNAGTNTLVGSFVAPAGVTQFIGFDADLELFVRSGPLPDWWKYKNAGTCRQSALSASPDFTSGPLDCADFFAGRAAGGIGTYDIQSGGGGFARIRLVFAVSNANAGPLTEGVEYYAFKLSFSNIKSVGDGACAGCETPVCIGLNDIRLVQPSALNDNRLLTMPSGRNFVTWQTLPLSSLCFIPTRASRSTWGAVKSLYR